MAGDWLKLDCSTPDKPEVLALTVKMGWDDPDLTVGKLFRLWRWFDQQTTDGNAAGVSAALLDKQVGVSGFINAVAEVGWLTVTADGVRLTKFEKHNGATAKSRAQTAKRVANHKTNGESNAKTNGDSVSGALPRGKEEEEKRREEESGDGARPTPGEACLAMKAAGMAAVNPSNPTLMALLDGGITLAELQQAARDAVDKGKPFAYALATAEGRRRDAAKVGVLPQQINKQEALEARNRKIASEWAHFGEVHEPQ